jgi:hypothetical protein
LASKLGPAQIAEQTAKLLRTATVGRAAKRSQLNLQGVSRFRGFEGIRERRKLVKKSELFVDGVIMYS